MAKRRLLKRIYLTHLLVILLCTLAMGGYALYELRASYMEQTSRDLEARARLVLVQVAGRLDRMDEAQLTALCHELDNSADTRITIIDEKGKVLGESRKDPETMDSHYNRKEVVEARENGRGQSVRHSDTLDRWLMYVAIRHDENGHTWFIRTALPLSGIYHTIWGLYLRVAIIGLIISLLAAGLALMVARKLGRPLEAVRDGAVRFAQGHFMPHIRVPGQDEVGEVAEAMNQMAAQLDEKIRSLARQRNEQQAVLASMVEGVVAVDQDARVISVNDAAAALMNVSVPELTGRPIGEAIRNVELERLLRQVLSSGQPAEAEIVIHEEADRIMLAHGTVLGEAEGAGPRFGAVAVLHDVTQLRRLENIRRDFVANVSHELKTPVTSIKGFVETLRDGAIRDPEKAQEFLSIMNRQADRLNAIIEDLLSLSRIEQEAEKHEIELKPGQIAPVLASAALACQSKADAKSIRIAIDAGPEPEAAINPRLLEQAVVNLIDNAIKYSNAGGAITVAARSANRDVLIEVADQGCGIDAEHLPRLFERFYRVDKARSRKLGGTGLGLAIVKHIVQAHHGWVAVQSTPGRGSTFTIHLPAGE
ncbi:MAG: Alkaline phosphatase synthesis sensor protein PhoR [Phycisphaerae bacterium]|nr:Alkaline phosphatase synthesis sensor protein PhoR [Phycisphaerae bacterium]